MLEGLQFVGSLKTLNEKSVIQYSLLGGGIPAFSLLGAAIGLALSRDPVVGVLGGFGLGMDAFRDLTPVGDGAPVVGADGSTGGSDGSTDPGTDTPPDPEDPIIPPDSGPLDPVVVVPTTLAAYMATKGSWVESTAKPYLNVRNVDGFISFTLVGTNSTEVLSINTLKNYIPNKVRFDGVSRVALDSQIAISYGMGFFDVLTSGHTLIDNNMSGFYLIDLINRDLVVAGVPNVPLYSTVFHSDGWAVSWDIAATPTTNVSLVTYNGIAGEAEEQREFSIHYKLKFGSTIDGVGNVTPVSSLGDLVRRIANNTKCWTIPSSSYKYYIRDSWGKYPASGARTVHPLPSLDLLAGHLRSVFNLDFGGTTATWTDLCLKYIDDSAVRDLWDGISLSSISYVKKVKYHSSIAPFLTEGTSRL